MKRTMLLKRLFTLALLITGTNLVYGQSVGIISGTLIEHSTDTPIFNAIVECTPADGSPKTHASSDKEGVFALPKLPYGSYTLKITYLGLAPYTTEIKVDQSAVTLGTIKMQTDEQTLKEVVVESTAMRTTLKGDTLIYNASSYKVTQDATTENLLSKMPGIKVEGGKVEAQGEDVKKLFVDGKEFFGDDVTTAIKNLPAEVIDKIQVYDQLSDQATMSGVDDGESYKAINVVTSRGISNATFGKFYAGYGFDKLYNAGASLNLFKENRRLTILGMANNINQQNFGMDDLLGVMGSSGRRGGGNAGNFMIGNQSGVSTVKSIGINYTNQWRDKWKIEGSYFFNTSTNFTQALTQREYFANQLYNEEGRDNSRNFNHRMSGRIEYKIDSSNTLSFRPSIRIQNNTLNSMDTSATFATDPNTEATLLNYFNQLRNNNATGYNLSGDLSYMHNFKSRPGRFLTLSLSGNTSKNDQDNTQYSLTRYLNPDSSSLLNQYIQNHSKSYRYSAQASYSEPLSLKSQLLFNYNISYNYSDRDKRSYDLPTDRFLDSLSNTYNSGYLTHRIGPGFRYNTDKVRLTTNINYQYATLTGDQQYPSVAQARMSANFDNVVYMAMLNVKFTSTNSLRLRLNSGTNNPTVNQLQNVMDVSNPLFITQGNPNLRPVYAHNLRLNYMHTNVTKGRTFMVMFGGSTQSNYITNSVQRATRPGYEVKDDAGNTIIVLDRGAQYSRPVNLNGYWNLNGVISYGTPVKWLSSNLNINLRTSYNATPTIYNLVQSVTKTTSYVGGLVLGSNISDKLDFTFSYNAGYNIARSANNNEYFNGVGSGRIKWITWKGITLQADGSYSKYRGISDKFTEEFFLLNASIGKKLFKNQRGEVNVTVYDILNQNKSFVRNVSENYIQNVTSNVLGRYVGINFIFNLRNFKGKDGKSYNQPENRNQFRNPDNRPPAGSGPRHGGEGSPPSGSHMLMGGGHGDDFM